MLLKFTSYRSTLQASEAAANNSDPHQTDPEALPTYNDQPTTIPSDHVDHTILPEYPGQTILQEPPSDTLLPEYQNTLLPEYQNTLLPEYQNTLLAGQDDPNTLPSYNNNLSPSAPPAEFAPMPPMPPMLPPTAEEGEAAAAMQALAAVEEAEEAAGRSDQGGYEEPPSYEAAMGGNI